MGKRVLVVDDSPQVLRGIRQLLESAGYEISGEAQNGALAIEEAERAEPDLIMLDLSM